MFNYASAHPLEAQKSLFSQLQCPYCSLCWARFPRWEVLLLSSASTLEISDFLRPPAEATLPARSCMASCVDQPRGPGSMSAPWLEGSLTSSLVKSGPSDGHLTAATATHYCDAIQGPAVSLVGGPVIYKGRGDCDGVCRTQYHLSLFLSLSFFLIFPVFIFLLNLASEPSIYDQRLHCPAPLTMVPPAGRGELRWG